MPATEYHRRPPSNLHSLPHHSLPPTSPSIHSQIATLLTPLSTSPSLLSLPWLHSLLSSFLSLLSSTSPPLHPSFLDRSLKSLDLLNAVRDSLHHLRSSLSSLHVALSALLPSRPHLRRARKALAEYQISSLHDPRDAAALSHRNRSFNRRGPGPSHRSSGHSRSLSWSVSKSWSAARQIQAIGANLSPPRAAEIDGGAGVGFAVNSVLFLSMWALVAAIPCQDRGIQVNFSVPKGFVWGGAATTIYERVMEESRRKERRNCGGLLVELHEIDNCVRTLTEMMDVMQLPVDAEKEVEIKEAVAELGKAVGEFTKGLDPLELQVREVFRRIARIRTDGLDSMGEN